MKRDLSSLRKPPALKPGDTIGVVAPSAHMVDEAGYQRGLWRLKECGFRVHEGRTIRSRSRYMAGTDEERAADIMRMFEDPGINGIVCLVGGSSANRILHRLDYSRIGANPKVFSGMSDITNLHLAFLARTGLVTLHGVDVTFGFGGEVGNAAVDYSVRLFVDVTSKNTFRGPIPAFGDWEEWKAGQATGVLVGGNLPVAALLAGTSYWPKAAEIILFWETIGSEIHEIDRLLNSLRLTGILETVKGMLVGQLPDCQEKEFQDSDASIRQITSEIAEEFGFPVLGNMDFGHLDQNMPLPLGLRARMATSPPLVELLENYVV